MYERQMPLDDCSPFVVTCSWQCQAAYGLLGKDFLELLYAGFS